MPTREFSDEETFLGFSAKRAAELADVPPRTAQHWKKEGFYHPSVASWEGSEEAHIRPWEKGLRFPEDETTWYYHLGDIAALGLAHDLRDAGVPQHMVKEIADHVGEKQPRKIPRDQYRTLVVDIEEEEYFWFAGPREELEGGPEDSPVKLYDFAALLDEICQAVDEELDRLQLPEREYLFWL